MAWLDYAALPDSFYFTNCQNITKGKASDILSFGVLSNAGVSAAVVVGFVRIINVEPLPNNENIFAVEKR